MKFRETLIEEVSARIELLPDPLLETLLSDAKANRKKGYDVRIDEDSQKITISEGSDSYVIEGSEAKELLDEVPDNIKPRDFILGLL